MELDERIYGCGLSPSGDMFVQVTQQGEIEETEKSDFGVDYINIDYKVEKYLKPKQIEKLKRYLEAISVLNTEDEFLAKPPSIGRGGTEAALHLKTRELENLERLAKLKSTSRKFGL
jgi:hypothetical protein